MKTERRRLTTDVYGLITTDEAGYQVACDLTRGTLLEIERDGRGTTRVRAAGRAFEPRKADLLRIERSSAPA
jgi:hypothetical protein